MGPGGPFPLFYDKNAVQPYLSMIYGGGKNREQQQKKDFRLKC